MRSDGFLHSGFLAVAVDDESFTAVTRVRIPSGTPNKTKNLGRIATSGGKGVFKKISKMQVGERCSNTF
jgi:hypothetical protein